MLENGGTLLLQGNAGNDGFVGPGHNGDIFTDKAGETWMLYHAFDKKNPAGRKMLLDKIAWEDEWPVMQNNDPTFTKQKGPVW